MIWLWGRKKRVCTWMWRSECECGRVCLNCREGDVVVLCGCRLEEGKQIWLDSVVGDVDI